MKDLIPLVRVVIRAIVRAFLPAAFEAARDAARDTAEDALPQPELKARLQNRVRATWGRAGAVALCIVLAAGCGTRSIYVSDGQPVRLRQPVKNAKVWVMDANGNPVPSRMTLPEGWYALPVPDADAGEPRDEVLFCPQAVPPSVVPPPDAPRSIQHLAAALP